MAERGAYPTREVLLEEVAALRRRLRRVEEILILEGLSEDLQTWLGSRAGGEGQPE